MMTANPERDARGRQTPEILRATPEAIARAGALVKAGRLVAFPTETVYGLGADATNDRAVALVFAAKRRPQFNPLIVHVASVMAARRLVRMPGEAERLAARFWPGPLTLVLPRRSDCPVSELASAGLDTLGIRAPDHPVARALVISAGRPIAAPSANPSGKLSPTTAEAVRDGLSQPPGEEPEAAPALVLDGGPCRVGLESTILAVGADGLRLLRPGGVPVEEIEAVAGPVEIAGGGTRPESPGQLESHYAPDLPLRLDASEAGPDEALLAFGPEPAEVGATSRNLSSTGDLVEAAANLFRMLRELDQPGLAAIAVMPVPETGLGRAINDRLRRASARRR